MTVIVRPPRVTDRSDWGRLYAGYAAFYGVTQDEAMRTRVWSWLMDANHEVTGFVAEADGRPVGLAHCRPFARPLAAATGIFLDDLFTDPESRGQGVAQALIAAVRDHAADEGATVVRWITAADNARAMAVYDRVATRTGWVTYDIVL
jgi:GNAT superfamily N-acetyltransferase